MLGVDQGCKTFNELIAGEKAMAEAIRSRRPIERRVDIAGCIQVKLDLVGRDEIVANPGQLSGCAITVVHLLQKRYGATQVIETRRLLIRQGAPAEFSSLRNLWVGNISLDEH